MAIMPSVDNIMGEAEMVDSNAEKEAIVKKDSCESDTGSVVCGKDILERQTLREINFTYKPHLAPCN